MVEPATASFVAECFWPGVTDDDLRTLAERAAACADELRAGGASVRYDGAILIREDEVVLCRFQGDAAAVRLAAERAAVPFERILETAESPWPFASPWPAGDGHGDGGPSPTGPA